MESNPNQLIENYESLFGSFTNNFPFNEHLEFTYKIDNRDDIPLKLHKDKSFTSYLMIIADDNSGTSIAELYGNYEVSIEKKLLTLNVSKVRSFFTRRGNFVTDEQQKELINILIEKITKIEIKNFHWLNQTISYPHFTASVSDKLNFDKFKFEESNMTRGERYSRDSDLENIKNAINAINDSKQTGTELVKSLANPIKYRGLGENYLTINPDGTLLFESGNYSHDSDGPYNWNSYLRLEGKWSYDVTNYTFKMICSKVTYSNDRTLEDYPLPNDIITFPFCFETGFINTWAVYWEYSGIKSLYTKLWTKEK